jgi:glutamate transport system permease protein
VGVVFENFAAFVDGVWVTVRLALLSFALAMLIGVFIAAFRVSPIPPLQKFATFYVAMFRNTPLVVLFALFFFGLTKVGIRYPPFTSSVLVLGAYTGAYISEAVRSGVNSVSRGQAEAARAIGLNFLQVLSLIVLPQALRTVVAPIGNLFIANVKNTSIAFTIGVVELTGTASTLTSVLARPLPLFGAAAFAYVLLIIPSGFVIQAIEQKVAIRR